MSASTAALAGFRAIHAGGSFMGHNGPLYLLQQGDGVRLGFRVEARRCNPVVMCHGGMLAKFADMLLPLVAHRTVGGAGAPFSAR